MRILFDSKDRAFKDPFGPVRAGEPCRFALLIPQSCGATEVSLMVREDEEGPLEAFPLALREEAGEYHRFSGEVTLRRTGLYFYHFHVRDLGGEYDLFREGNRDTNIGVGEKWQLSCIPADFVQPEAFFGRTMYQIFPDRFARSGACDTAGKLTPFWIHEFPSEPPEWRPAADGKIKNCDFYGGNLRGITEKLEYLADLGVGVIYLNPIFKAYSNHRYDTADYKKIDELLGTEEEFATLCREAHARDIRVILDGVFSHTGADSVYFDREGRFGGGAYSDPDSPYREWYDFQKWPDEYTCWWDILILPCVREENESFLRYIIDDEDSVVAHWIRLGADGFRLDVADELPDAFILRLRRRLKELKPDALLIGEVWEDASNKVSYGVRRTYFSAGELDGVMNYPLRSAIVDFVRGETGAEELSEQVMTLAENYPAGVIQCNMDMLSTHDTVRILTLLSDPPEGLSKEQKAVYRLPPEARAVGMQRLRMAMALQFFLPGMPCIFYGDEIGTEGFEDPFCRSFYDWQGGDGDLRALTRALAHLRREIPALRCGSVEVEPLDGGAVAIRRCAGDSRVLCVVHRGPGEIGLPEGELLFSRGEVSPGGARMLSPGGFAVLKIE